MNKVATFILSIGLFGAGVATGYYICKKRLEEDFDAEMEDYKEYLAEQFAANAADEPESEYESPEISDENDEEREESLAKANQLINKELYSEPKGRARINYNKPSMEDLAKRIEEEKEEAAEEPPEPEELERDEDYEAELEAAAEAEVLNRYHAEQNGEPYLISYEEYVDGVEGYEAQSLYFYTKDGVLCEDDDTPIADHAVLVGYDFERKLEMQTSAFVRNDDLMTLYEIHRIVRSYAEDVAGVAETPTEREMRIISRRKAAKDAD